MLHGFNAVEVYQIFTLYLNDFDAGTEGMGIQFVEHKGMLES